MRKGLKYVGIFAGCCLVVAILLNLVQASRVGTKVEEAPAAERLVGRWTLEDRSLKFTSEHLGRSLGTSTIVLAVDGTFSAQEYPFEDLSGVPIWKTAIGREPGASVQEMAMYFNLRLKEVGKLRWILEVDVLEIFNCHSRSDCPIQVKRGSGGKIDCIPSGDEAMAWKVVGLTFRKP